MAPESRERHVSSMETSTYKRQRHYYHYHTSYYKQLSEVAYADDVNHQLRRAIAVVLKQVGFEDAKPEALESFQLVVEECEFSIM